LSHSTTASSRIAASTSLQLSYTLSIYLLITAYQHSNIRTNAVIAALLSLFSSAISSALSASYASYASYAGYAGCASRAVLNRLLYKS
jgi:hypothetical protein